MKKMKTAIIGTGNIGMDLLMKIRQSDVLECGIFAGKHIDSPNMIMARQMGVPVTEESIGYIKRHPDCCQIVFDATSAAVHRQNAPVLDKLGKFVVDLTPSHVGEFCVPVINLDSAVKKCANVNMVTCGGQAAVPLVYAISQVQPDIRYIEVVATIASKSAGPGTRNNIDEFTQTTREAVTHFTGIKNAKAIIVLNPAEPPVVMHNTIYMLIDRPDMAKIQEAAGQMERKVKKYVPGYHIVTGPVYENGRITITLQVIGSGDYLPQYAGNLDIITCAAMEAANAYARKYGG